MNKCKFVRVQSIILAAALVWLLPAFAAGQAVTTQLTATDIFDPLNLFGNDPVGEYLNPGSLSCPGTQPTGNPMQPCPPGSRIMVRGAISRSRVISESPLLTGWFYAENNADLDAGFAGRAWGTFRIKLDAGGVWQGSFTEERSEVEDANLWVSYLRIVAHGMGGIVEGMHLRATEVAPTFTPLPVAWVGVMDAQILAPPSK